MNHRRLVGIDLGIATAHTVRVLDGEGAGQAAPLHLVIAVVWIRVIVLQQHRLAGGVELSELRDGAAEPDLAGRGVDIDKAERDKPAVELAVVDHEMGDGTSAQMNDHAAHLAADFIGTADVSPDRERRRLRR
jgi:hypothetical protein